MALTRKAILDKLRIKYKLVVLNDDTFEEKAAFTLNGISAIVVSSSIVVILVLLVALIIIFTPLKEYIPGFSDVKLRKDVSRMIAKSDSLESIQEARDSYIFNLKNVLSGRVGVEALNQKDKPVLIDSISLNSKRPSEDLALREMIEAEEKENPGNEEKLLLIGIEFVSPVKGVITEKFKPAIQHYAVDVACRKGEKIKAVANGTVILAAFTKETGNVIVVQHENNLLSIYKHCSVLTKKVDNFVKSGEVIAIVGNTGEFTTGPHLHIELWYDGKAINPQDYIKF